MANPIQILPIEGLPEIEKGMDLVGAIMKCCEASGIRMKDGDVLVITSKAVAKWEGRVVKLEGIEPSAFSRQIAPLVKKDPRLVELILLESKRVVRMVRGLLLTQTRQGFVCANAGVDQSNVPQGTVALLPKDADRSARRIRRELLERFGLDVAVIITDTFGRAWREGQTDVAIGVAGMLPLLDYRGRRDRYGYELKVTTMAIADELAAAAELVMGKLKGVPAALIQGYEYPKGEGSARQLVRSPSRDLFR